MDLQQKLNRLEERIQRLVEGAPTQPPDAQNSTEPRSRLGDTAALRLSADLPENIASDAFLIVGGNTIFPITTPIVNIGRSPENHLMVPDGRVSRHHAQLRTVGGRFMLFDLESTGGTFVNNQRIIQTTLFPGDLISLAGVQIIFGCDQPSQPDETREIPLS